MKDAVKTIGNLIDKQGVSFISSVDENGYPNTKAMLPPRKREGIKVFYFTTNTSSMRVKQYRSNPQACTYFCDRRFFRGVMLIGTMEVLEDSFYKEMIWQEGDTIITLKVLLTRITAYCGLPPKKVDSIAISAQKFLKSNKCNRGQPSKDFGR